MRRRPPTSKLFPYTTLFRSAMGMWANAFFASTAPIFCSTDSGSVSATCSTSTSAPGTSRAPAKFRSEEHTSELQSHVNLVCRLLLEKKNHNVLQRALRHSAD